MTYVLSRLRASLPVAALIAATTAAQAQVPTVVTDLPVTHALAAMVMGDLGTPVLLLERGADAHGFALRPSQARAVAGADLTVWMGAAMSPWMARTVAGLAPEAQLELLAVEGLRLHPFAEQPVFGEADQHHGHAHGHSHGHGHPHGHGHGHGHAHGHGHGHSHGHDDHTHGELDPHAWFDPENAAIWVGAIATRLAALDPVNAATYQANAAAAQARIAAVKAEVQDILTPVGDAGIVVHHDAYGYFARAFGVNILGTVALGDAAEPGAARLAALRDRLAAAGAVCIFPEVNHSAAYAAMLAEATGVRIGAPLDPEGVALEPGADLYPALLTNTARAIADCVTGG